MESGIMNDESAVSLKTLSSGVSNVVDKISSGNINVGSGERIASVLLGAAGTIYGLKNINSLPGILSAIAGGMLLQRGLTGYCMVNEAVGRNTAATTTSAMEVKETFTINKPKAEVYAFWRKLENLPQFMKHLEKVEEQDQLRSTWKAKIPGGVGSVSWEAEIKEDRPGELISWSSLPGSTVDNTGEVRFEDGIQGETQVSVFIVYSLPAGAIGALAAKLFNPAVENMMKDDLQRFKNIFETGESPNAEGSLSFEGDKSKGKKTRKSKKNSPDFTTTDQPIDQDTIQTYENNMMERD
jgi:uncharacterized membrane protein